MPPRNRIIMIKRRTSKRVTLPDGRTFLARYRRATRNELPRNVNLIRPYKQRAAPKGKRKRRRVNQHGTGFGSTLKKAVNFGKKAFNSKLGKKNRQNSYIYIAVCIRNSRWESKKQKT